LISKKFVKTIKLHDKRAYEIANEAGIHQTKLSHIMNGVCTVEPGDINVLAVAKVIGLSPEDCFE
jgi:hypothetical protein